MAKQCCERDHDHDGNCDRHPEVKLPKGWEPPFTKVDYGYRPEFAINSHGRYGCYDRRGHTVVESHDKEVVDMVAHALNTTYAQDGELAQAKRKIEALMKAGDGLVSFIGGDLTYHIDWTAAKEMP